jgi:hypothetical protein
MGTPPRVARRRSTLAQRRMNASVAATITEEEHVQPVDLFFSLDGDFNAGASSHEKVCV